MSDLISREAAIHIASGYCHPANIAEELRKLPAVQPKQRWNRLMMYLADLQLTYSPGWGANGQGDEKIYEFVTGLIDELQGWEEEAT